MPTAGFGPAGVRPRPTVAAVIDIGSNSVLLLAVVVEDGRAVARDSALETTRLGAGLRDGGRLDPAAAERTRAAVVACAKRARRAGAGRVWAFATAAVRRAADGRPFARMLAERASVAVEVLSGEREAALAYASVRASLSGHDGAALLAVDVGGGTTELTLGAGDRPFASASLPLGALALSERRGLGSVTAAVDACLRTTTLPGQAAEAGATVVASGGTATALAALDLGLSAYDPRRVHGHVLDGARLDTLVRDLWSGRMRLDGLDPGRAATLPAGAVVLQRIVAVTGAPRLRVSDHGVRHAYLRERLAADGVVADFRDLWR